MIVKRDYDDEYAWEIVPGKLWIRGVWNYDDEAVTRNLPPSRFSSWLSARLTPVDLLP